MNRRWICSDVWMDILPYFGRRQLGLKMALISDRFDVLVDTHFDAKSELTIWRQIKIYKEKNIYIGLEARLSLCINGRFVDFPLPDIPLPNNIRLKRVQIDYIDHSVLAFLRANKQIWDRRGTNLELHVSSSEDNDVQPIWDVLACEILPIFAPSIRCLGFTDDEQFDSLCRCISPTILADLDQLDSINFDHLYLDGIADDGLNGTSSAGQVLAKWLNTPRKDGKPKQLFCEYLNGEGNLVWLNSFKETFIHATASASYKICFGLLPPTPIEPFELVNEWTNEKLTLSKGETDNFWLLKRCPIIVGETAAADQWENDDYWDHNFNTVQFVNTVQFALLADGNCIGPLSPPEEEEKEEADESNEN